MKNYIVATLGSHSALQILKGAKDEGFATLLFATEKTVSFYKRFSFIDTIIPLKAYSDVLSYKSRGKSLILIPHGSFVAYLGTAGNAALSIPYFGNKHVLSWEEDRGLQMQWFAAANMLVPKIFAPETPIDRPVIVKSYGAAGGKGYFVAHTQKDFNRQIKTYRPQKYIIQEYVIGVPMYLHFFYSPITKIIELLSIDRRYETNVDALGRIPLAYQQRINPEPSFVVVGNSPLSLRESLMPEAYAMAERIIAASHVLVDHRGLFGPFCLETIVTPDQKLYVIEISCRIVAGTNLFINGSAYASLYYDEPMSTGRRIAREIKIGIKEKKLHMLLD